MTKYRLKGTAGAVINRSIPLAERLTIGSAPDSDVHIDVDGEDSLAVEIGLLEDGRVTFTCPTETAGVMVNGVAMITGSLRSGDELRIGPCAFLLQAPGLRPERILSGEAAVPRRRFWPWLAAAAAAALLALMAWQRGWFG
jgi:hypothetical protein